MDLMQSAEIPQERKSVVEAETLVVKIGSRVLTSANGDLDLDRIASISRQVAELCASGRQVVLVSSGAVAAGVAKLSLQARPADLAELQAVAAVGQTFLIQVYEKHLASAGRHAAQILLVADDLEDRVRYLNVRNTLNALLKRGVVPVINENDSVAVEELQMTFGDNDRLAAMVAGLFDRPALIILSDVSGLFDRSPEKPDAQQISTVEQVDQSVLEMAAVHSSSVSKGGMASKLRAASFVCRSGTPVVIAAGKEPNVLLRVAAGQAEGTVFVPQSKSLALKKRWLGFSVSTIGRLILDDGAVDAVTNKGSSLLPIGVVKCDGDFKKGDLLALTDTHGREVARGLSNYSAAELKQIAGLRSDAIAEQLGHCPYEEVVHRDNMVMTG